MCAGHSQLVPCVLEDVSINMYVIYAAFPPLSTVESWAPLPSRQNKGIDQMHAGRSLVLPIEQFRAATLAPVLKAHIGRGSRLA
jgi:hypothetical protein